MPWTKQFDPKLALQKAMEVFWIHGYEQASLVDLLDAMGIQKGSFYATFKSKHDLYLLAIEAYAKERFTEFEQATQGKPPREAILALLDFVRKECLGGMREKGCLALNCVLDRAQDDAEALAAVQKVLNAHERQLARLVREAKALGDVPETVDANQAAKVLLGLTIAMRVFGKAKSPASNLNALYQQANKVLAG